MFCLVFENSIFSNLYFDLNFLCLFYPNLDHFQAIEYKKNAFELREGGTQTLVVRLLKKSFFLLIFPFAYWGEVNKKISNSLDNFRLGGGRGWESKKSKFCYRPSLDKGSDQLIVYRGIYIRALSEGRPVSKCKKYSECTMKKFSFIAKKTKYDIFYLGE